MRFGTQEVGGYRVYSWTGPNNYTNQYPSDSIIDAQLQNKGWYHLVLFTPDGSCKKVDSLYFDIKLQQGIPPCTIASNTTTYNNMGSDNYYSITKGIESNYSEKALSCNGSGDMTIYFHPYWRNFEPEDGIYYTTNTPLFDQFDNNYNKVSIAITTNSISWASNPNQLVYISHIGSKLQVRFCNVTLTGYNGTSFKTLASSNMIEP